MITAIVKEKGKKIFMTLDMGDIKCKCSLAENKDGDNTSGKDNDDADNNTSNLSDLDRHLAELQQKIVKEWVDKDGNGGSTYIFPSSLPLKLDAHKIGVWARAIVSLLLYLTAHERKRTEERRRRSPLPADIVVQYRRNPLEGSGYTWSESGPPPTHGEQTQADQETEYCNDIFDCYFPIPPGFSAPPYGNEHNFDT
jgi:hypothetical protein